MNNKKRYETKKIAYAAVMSAIAAIAVVVARYTPIGWVLFLAVAGIATLLSCRLCGFKFGVLTYIATSLITLAVMPHNVIYVLVIGLHALARDYLFGQNSANNFRPKYNNSNRPYYLTIIRIVLGYILLFGAFYGLSLACVIIMKSFFGIDSFIKAVGGNYYFSLVLAGVLVLYDFVLSYLTRGIMNAIMKSTKNRKQTQGDSQILDNAEHNNSFTEYNGSTFSDPFCENPPDDNSNNN